MSTHLNMDDVAHGNPLAEQELRELRDRAAKMLRLLREWRSIDPNEFAPDCDCLYCRRERVIKGEAQGEMIRTTQLTVLPSDNAKLYDVGVYTVTVDDEGGGEYLIIKEQQDEGRGKIRVDRDSWPELKQAVEQMLGGICQ